MFAVVVLAELEHIRAKLGTYEPLAETDPVIGEMMPCPAEGRVRQCYCWRHI